MSLSPERIADNLDTIRERMASAATRAGRSPDEICLVAVTKYVDSTVTRMLVDAGCPTLGESRPQLLWNKAEDMSDVSGIQWHMIGHLQRNKLARTLPIISVLQSVDSERLLASVNEQSKKLNITTSVLLEINISGDQNKHGFAPELMRELLQKTAQCDNVRVKGVMGMASRDGGIDQARRDFSALRELRDSLRHDCPENTSLDEISMGMSGDFEVAIEEGATIVRVGSALFAE